MTAGSAPLSAPWPAELPLIPRPLALAVHGGTLTLTSLREVSVSHGSVLPVAERFLGDLRRWTGLELDGPRISGTRGRVGVRIELSGPAPWAELSPESAAATGAHTLTIDSDGFLVKSESLEGLYRGLTSVVQAIGTGAETVPKLQIIDRARYGWRGLSLDTARSFVPVEEVRRIIDLLALYKFDVLHLHLTDNEGWRLQVPGWPELTPEPGDGPVRFYTLDDLAELNRYSADRFITVVPEIDLPGHAGAALRAYPGLNPGAVDELDRPFPRANLDPGSEEAWRFLDDVVSALAAAAAGPYVHIGGDEAFGMDDAAHAAFVDRAVARAGELGKTVIGWQETSRADVGAEQIVQHWIDFSGAEAGDDDAARDAADAPGPIPPAIQQELTANFRKAAGDGRRIADKGVRVIMSPTGHAYLDRPHQDVSLDDEQNAKKSGLGLAYYPPTPLAAYLEWDPATVTPAIPARSIVGVEAALWTETADSADDRGALLLPRLPAIAEAAWSEGTSHWSEYRERLGPQSRLWERAGVPWYRASSVPWGLPGTVPSETKRRGSA
ncbi:family 20 glycosylhydrolase [Sinomonas humi]|uniref:family 20 glycosylhydrolase n=1 Tax=Sinomonas humi TaxID=1338436 RepID=UPI0006914DDA|nr:family 20 glycosylhydrolase [Sinomonas humi]